MEEKIRYNEVFIELMEKLNNIMMKQEWLILTT